MRYHLWRAGRAVVGSGDIGCRGGFNSRQHTGKLSLHPRSRYATGAATPSADSRSQSSKAAFARGPALRFHTRATSTQLEPLILSRILLFRRIGVWFCFVGVRSRTFTG